ncbi:MAG: prepilin peptidase [Gemmataceae bacterium]
MTAPSPAAPFFPNEAFAVTFIVALMAYLVVAAYADLKTTIIPKSLTLVGFAVGILFNIVRLAWFAAEGRPSPTALIASDSAAIGVLNGLLFSLIGFVFGFSVYFLLWILGAAGGGDVKHFAALSAWLGWWMALGVLIVTLVVVAGLILFQAAQAAMTGQWKKLRKSGKRFQDPNRERPVKRLITFGAPLAVSAAIVLGWAFRYELHLTPPQAASTVEAGHGK